MKLINNSPSRCGNGNENFIYEFKKMIISQAFYNWFLVMRSRKGLKASLELDEGKRRHAEENLPLCLLQQRTRTIQHINRQLYYFLLASRKRIRLFAAFHFHPAPALTTSTCCHAILIAMLILFCVPSSGKLKKEPNEWIGFNLIGCVVE